MKLFVKGTAFTAVLINIFLANLSTINSYIEDPNYSILTNNPKSNLIVYDDNKGLSLKEIVEQCKQVDLYDSEGIKVLSINKFNKPIFLNILKPGQYKVEIKTNGGELIIKTLIKI